MIQISTFIPSLHRREEWENGIVYNGSWDQGLKMGLGVYFDPNTNRRYGLVLPWR